ncbi:MAG: hypothetical protein ABF242_09465 [Flavobacteriales bacterium]
MNKIISHEISKLGKVDIALHHHSTDFYLILEKHGLIDYLKNLDHLGFISKSHPGNNHKRWDYIMLQLHIIHKLKDEIFRTGLSSNHSIDKKNQTSGIVILQIAILFANLGHLNGTLAAETELIHFIKNNPKKKKEFFEEISKSKDWSQFANNIIDKNDYYKSKYLVALNYLLKNVKDKEIQKIILLFFKNSLIDDEPRLRKLKWIFHKVRQISFIYLDSFNSDFPFQVDITKILLNIFNYKNLFNPNSFDFESFFDSAETTLTKKLYISPKAINAFHINSVNFNDYLKKQISKRGNNKLEFNDFLKSLISRDVKPFDILSPNDNKCHQFYISKDDIEIFGMKRTLFNYEEAVIKNYEERIDFESLINRNLLKKPSNVCLIHDGRKTLFFINLIVNQSQIGSEEQNQFLLNYLNIHYKFLEKFKFTSPISNFKIYANIFFYKHYTRKIFLQLFKIIFKCEYDLSAYIKFDNHQLIHKLTKEDPKFHVSGFANSKASLKTYFEDIIGMGEIPIDIKNNHGIAKYIIENVTRIKRYVKAFYCSFPIEIDKYSLDPAKLYKQQNPESAKTLTDIDMVLAIFNSSKFELYIIEGKNQMTGFESSTRDDFNNRIKPYLLHPDKMPKINIVNKSGAKGGYICYKN